MDTKEMQDSWQNLPLNSIFWASKDCYLKVLPNPKSLIIEEEPLEDYFVEVAKYEEGKSRKTKLNFLSLWHLRQEKGLNLKYPGFNSNIDVYRYEVILQTGEYKLLDEASVLEIREGWGYTMCLSILKTAILNGLVEEEGIASLVYGFAFGAKFSLGVVREKKTLRFWERAYRDYPETFDSKTKFFFKPFDAEQYLST